jgi:hypothetical protein
MSGTRWLLSRVTVPLATLGRDRRPSVRMGEKLTVVDHALLVLPFSESRRQHVLRQVFEFKAGFPRWRLDLLLIGGEPPPGGPDGFKGIGLITAGSEAVTALGLPSRQLVEELRERSFDLAIDLSMDGHPFVPLLLHRAGIPLKMGVDGPGRLRHRLYNLFFRLKDPDEVMSRLVDTLAPICMPGTA